MPLRDSLPDAAATAALARDTLSVEGAARVVAFIGSRRAANGLFRDRAGRPDLYYTVFGLDGLIALQAALPTPHGVIRSFFDADNTPVAGGSFIDWASHIRCLRGLRLLGHGRQDDACRLERALARLEGWRSADGGYAHEWPRAAHGTVYAAYLAEQAYRDAGAAWPEPERAIASLDALRTPDGGYSNHPGTRRCTATATAAAAVLLARCGARERALQAAAVLAALRHPEGGTRAAPSVPLPDLLSTATALYAESLCPPLPAAAPFRETAAFVESLWSDDGGFRGHAADPIADVEYTFYALLALGALAAIRARSSG